MEFNELNLHPDLQRGIADAGYVTCMPVQEQVLTNAFGGQDLYVQSQTGTGKTAAFLIVIFQRLLTEPLLNGKKALIMVPTRELAVQVEEEARVLGKYLPFKVGSFYGGVGYAHQQKLLRENAQVMVGTPGRVLDLNSSGYMNLMDLSFLVLDEADRMFDMGFYPDLRKLIRVVPPADRRQTMLFSATLNAYVKNLAWEYTKEPVEIEIAPEKVTVEEIDQVLYHVPSNDKMKMLLGIMEREKPESAIIFCNTKRYAEIVAKRLRINGYECEFIMGDLPQSKRLKIIEDVKAGNTKYLVATDVAARGLDIEGLALVVNYDLPVESENYVHRIGRTARAGKTGRAITFASEQDVYELPDIEKYIGKKIPSEIATEELYGADKSEGMRIHTDTYDDRHDDRRRGRRDGDRGRSGQQRDGGQGRSRTRNDDRRRQGNETRKPPRREAQGNPRQKPGEDRNLSNLSFDERMAYYKKKYDAPSKEASGGGAHGASAKGKGGGRNHPQGNKQRQGNNNNDRRPANNRQNQERNRTAPGKKQETRQPAPAAKPAPAKKGLLARIKGLFKKES
ncbi:DEAD/DEAH box helicase [Breznakiella homolactica]|uniref:DEAD/DEAH box helicase n=1 Tax=Breznakiella homolactica TaxID=2798577 RepID=A0A7T8BCW8_9SPIR|nr:DEAD/DEAH box helicase [Breznakiella homolactica]QQO10668.1 DEAD/DEAH box helicase [Breznakiella homolactica]